MKILEEYGISEAELRRILQGKKKKPKILKKHITDKTFKFGIVSDTHLCSNEERLDELHTFYSICKKEGITEIVHSGDLIAGQGIYKGQENEISAFGADNQVAYAVENYPKGITTYFITGNHCLSYWKQNGVDIGEMVASRRKDMVYLGQYQGEIELGGVRIRLIHPDGGMPYAMSYRGQKLAEQIPSGRKPHILILGHLHTSYYFHYRLMHVFGAGSFEGQTSFLLRKGINPNIGGWIIKVHIATDKKKSVVSITPSWIPFF